MRVLPGACPRSGVLIPEGEGMSCAIRADGWDRRAPPGQLSRRHCACVTLLSASGRRVRRIARTGIFTVAIRLYSRLSVIEEGATMPIQSSCDGRKCEGTRAVALALWIIAAKWTLGRRTMERGSSAVS